MTSQSTSTVDPTHSDPSRRLSTNYSVETLLSLFTDSCPILPELEANISQLREAKYLLSALSKPPLLRRNPRRWEQEAGRLSPSNFKTLEDYDKAILEYAPDDIWDTPPEVDLDDDNYTDIIDSQRFIDKQEDIQKQREMYKQTQFTTSAQTQPKHRQNAPQPKPAGNLTKMFDGLINVQKRAVDPSLLTGECWYYIDNSGQLQGPFATQNMSAWSQRGYIKPDLYIRLSSESKFMTVAERFEGGPSFQTPPLALDSFKTPGLTEEQARAATIQRKQNSALLGSQGTPIVQTSFKK
ncbi:hypothetical protein BLNAU_5772 [Blattamonas nauphoetae]|uniref:GYF domain-containing protein n=1 Tax=Blattamonas nauphoetae TaxID=2049346 RepID=A0ABQ9Y6C4_9EUKA|nr:hypothetical protein BLNAU_5772 [Blattamonas nauphoetae]